MRTLCKYLISMKQFETNVLPMKQISKLFIVEFIFEIEILEIYSRHNDV